MTCPARRLRIGLGRDHVCLTDDDADTLPPDSRLITVEIDQRRVGPDELPDLLRQLAYVFDPLSGLLGDDGRKVVERLRRRWPNVVPEGVACIAEARRKRAVGSW